MVTTLDYELRRIESPVSVDGKLLSKSRQERLDEIAREEERDIRMATIEKFAEKHRAIANVIDGTTSFLEIGKPIIEQSERVEAEVRSKAPFQYVSKRRILGNDSRDSEDVKEGVDYLIGQRVINPNKHFHSRIILPERLTNAGKYVGDITFDSKSSNHSAACVTICGFLVGSYIGHKYLPGTESAPKLLSGGVAGSGVALASMLVGIGFPSVLLGNSSISKLTKDREDFTSALNYLDGEVRRLYPTTPQEREVA